MQFTIQHPRNGQKVSRKFVAHGLHKSSKRLHFGVLIGSKGNKVYGQSQPDLPKSWRIVFEVPKKFDPTFTLVVYELTLAGIVREVKKVRNLRVGGHFGGSIDYPEGAGQFCSSCFTAYGFVTPNDTRAVTATLSRPGHPPISATPDNDDTFWYVTFPQTIPNGTYTLTVDGDVTLAFGQVAGLDINSQYC